MYWKRSCLLSAVYGGEFLCVLYQNVSDQSLKGIVSRDFGGLQMIWMDRIVVPDVPLEVYSFLNVRFHIVF